MKAFDKVDIIVNNAGTSRAMPFERVTDEILYDDLELKLFAAVRLIRLVAPQMKERRWGRIINVLNIGAKAPRPNSMLTSISRAAGMAMTKALSHELAPHNVLVNALLVGFIRADQHVQLAKRADMTVEEYYKAHAKEIPSAAQARPRNALISPASWCRSKAAISPVRRSMSMAGVRPLCNVTDCARPVLQPISGFPDQTVPPKIPG
jgi:3-oxoacyl-[acyl-carrier protein] reductase